MPLAMYWTFESWPINPSRRRNWTPSRGRCCRTNRSRNRSQPRRAGDVQRRSRREIKMMRIDKDAEWWLEMAKKEGDYAIEVPYSGTPCLCGKRREEDCDTATCGESPVKGQKPKHLLRCACCGEAEPQNGWSYAAYLCNNNPDEVFCTSKCFEAHEDRLCGCFSDEDDDRESSI